MIYQHDYYYILVNYIVHDSSLFVFVWDRNTVENDLNNYFFKMNTRFFKNNFLKVTIFYLSLDFLNIHLFF